MTVNSLIFSIKFLYILEDRVTSTIPCGDQMIHYRDVIMNTMPSHITSLAIVYTTVYSGADQRKHQSSASLAFVRGIHRRPVNFPHKWPVTRTMFPFDDVIMCPMCRRIIMLETSIRLYFCSTSGPWQVCDLLYLYGGCFCVLYREMSASGTNAMVTFLMLKANETTFLQKTFQDKHSVL